jgi:hypothetical protein
VKIRNIISAKFEVTGMIKPGARSEKILNTSTKNVHNLTTHDDIVMSAGANDVYRNIALMQVTTFIDDNYSTNIIILDIPHMYDLSASSCVYFEGQ